MQEVLKQTQDQPLSVPEQMVLLLAVTTGQFDGGGIEQIAAGERTLCQAVTAQLPEVCKRVHAGEALTTGDRAALLGVAHQTLQKSD